MFNLSLSHNKDKNILNNIWISNKKTSIAYYNIIKKLQIFLLSYNFYQFALIF